MDPVIGVGIISEGIQGLSMFFTFLAYVYMPSLTSPFLFLSGIDSKYLLRLPHEHMRGAGLHRYVLCLMCLLY